MPAWSIVRPDRGILREDEVESLLDRLPKDDPYTPSIKCLVSILYLYGPRISEALLLKRKDMNQDGRFLWIRFITKKKRRKKPVDPRRRSKPIPEDRTLNVLLTSPFIENILSYTEDLEDDTILFHFSYPTAYRKIVWMFGLDKDNRERSMQEVNVWLHLFRDTCLTQLAYAGANPAQLMVWAGWSSMDPAVHYIERSRQMVEELAELRAKRGFGKYNL